MHIDFIRKRIIEQDNYMDKVIDNPKLSTDRKKELLISATGVRKYFEDKLKEKEQ